MARSRLIGAPALADASGYFSIPNSFRGEKFFVVFVEENVIRTTAVNRTPRTVGKSSHKPCRIGGKSRRGAAILAGSSKFLLNSVR